MKLPRDVYGGDLVKALVSLGFAVDRQSGSHVRMVHEPSGKGVTVPLHRPIRVGTLAQIVGVVSVITGLTRDEIILSISKKQ